jgi:hypothetical protein
MATRIRKALDDLRDVQEQLGSARQGLSRQEWELRLAESVMMRRKAALATLARLDMKGWRDGKTQGR